MDDRRIFIRHGGNWEGSTYKGGTTDMVFVHSGLTYEGLIELVHETVNADRRTCVYDLRTVLNEEEEVYRFKIKNDRDVQYLLGLEIVKLVVFVCVQQCEKHVNDPIMPQCKQPEQHINQQSFVELMAAQYASASGSNYVYCPRSGFRVQSSTEQSHEPLLDGDNDGRIFPEDDSTIGIDDSDTYSEDDSLSTSNTHDEDGIEDVANHDEVIRNFANHDDNGIENVVCHDDSNPEPEGCGAHVDWGQDDHVDCSPLQPRRIQVPDLNVTNYEPSEETAQGASQRRQWTLPGSTEISLQTIPTMMSSIDTDFLYKDAIFESKEELKNNLGMFALKRKFEYRVTRSSTTRFEASCKQNGCTFKMRAHGSERGMWRVVKFVRDHSCNADLYNDRPRQVPTKVISCLIASKLQDNGRMIRPRDVIGDVRADHGIEILYTKAWRAREYAQNLVYGDPSQSFQLLPSYLYMLEKENPGTVTKIQTDVENKFEFMFFALGPSIHSFRSCCRPVIVIDGTHLKGKFRGVMFVAATKDGNEQIFPVAFGIGDGENDRSWTWFLTELRNVIGSPNDLMIVSDRHISIENAVNEVFPDRAHGLCSYHLKQNLKKFKNADVCSTFNIVSRLYRQADFNKQMHDMRTKHVKAYHYLLQAGVGRWSRAYSPVRRYEFMTSNIAENINSCMKQARKLPICALIEFARDMLQRWFYDRRVESGSRDMPLTEWASAHLKDSMDAAQYLSVIPVDSVKYKVKDSKQHWVVNLEQRTCSCRHFDLDLLPCAHAAAAIRHAKLSSITFCSEYYHASTWVETYSGRINPLPIPEEWDVPEEIKQIVVHPPEYRSQPGRRRTRRIPSSGERRTRRRQLCSRCKQAGHNRVNCNNPVHLQGGSTSRDI